jgi:hypothetical protein
MTGSQFSQLPAKKTKVLSAIYMKIFATVTLVEA